MAKITALSELTSLVRGDLFPVVDASASATKKIKIENIIGGQGIVVAASDAPASWKRRAYAVCNGTDDQDEVQAAIDSITGGGDFIQLSPGTFVMAQAGSVDIGEGAVLEYSAYINQDHPQMSIVGVPNATIFKLDANQTPNTSPIVVYGTTGGGRRTVPTLITGIEFDGNYANQTGTWTDQGLISCCKSDYVDINGNYFHDWAASGFSTWIAKDVNFLRWHNNRTYGDQCEHLHLANAFYSIMGNIFEGGVGMTSGAMLASKIADVGVVPQQSQTIVGNVFYGGYKQISVEGGHSVVIASNVCSKVTDTNGMAIYIAKYGGLLPQDALNCIVALNTIKNVRHGIQLIGDANNGVKNSIVALNTILEGTDVNLYWGIHEAGATNQDNQILYNQIVGASFPIVATGPGVVVRGNIGYVTENKGAAATVADGGTIAHGCDATPTIAHVQASVAGDIATVTSIDATNITVAIKDGAGDPGTTQTIYWSAEV
jgi:hypothetical protein